MNQLRQLEQDTLARGREWTRRRLQEELQQQSAALPMVCPQSQQPLRQTRWRSLHFDTVVGTVKLRVRHGYSPAQGCWICPAGSSGACSRTSAKAQSCKPA